MSIFKRGDIVKVRFNPTDGKEIQGEFRPALVVTPKAFNTISPSWVLAITQGGLLARYEGFAVSLMSIGLETQGVILCNQLRSMDLQTRGAKYIETVPDFIMDEVNGILQAILEGNLKKS